MRTAICFAGTARAFKYTYDSIRDDFIRKVPNCDTFFLLPTNPYAYTIEKYLDPIDITKLVIEDEAEVDQTNLRFQARWPGRANSSHEIYLKMLQARKRLGSILKEHCKATENNYDRVIFSRLDVRYIEFPPPALDAYDLTKLHIPDFHNFSCVQGRGYNDRFALSNLDNMLIYFNAFDKIQDFCNLKRNLHAESYLHWYLTTSNMEIRKCPVRFRRMRSNGVRSPGDDRLEASPFVPIPNIDT